MPATSRAANPWSSRLTPVSSNAASSGFASSRGFMACAGRVAAASLDNAGFAIVLLGAGMQRHRHPFECLLDIDGLGRGMRRDELFEAGPQRPGHAVSDIVAHAFVRDQI